MNHRCHLLSLLLLGCIAGCGGSQDASQQNSDHPWKSQTDTLQQARDAADAANQNAEQKRDAMQRSTDQ